MDYNVVKSIDQLDEKAQQLLRESNNMRQFSYAPYSGFAVGAALRCKDGSVYTGCNVENASFPASICAERCALVKAVSDGKQSFESIGVVAERLEGRLTTPCGVCRQMLSEFGEITIYVSGPEMREVLITSTDNLLPHAFVCNNKAMAFSSKKN